MRIARNARNFPLLLALPALLALPVGIVAAQHFDAANGRPLLDMQQLMAMLEREGYTRISEVDREGMVWEIEAVDRRGNPVELHVSGHDGRILRREREFPDFGLD